MLVSTARAQLELSIFDAVSGHPLDGVKVEMYSLNDRQQEKLISNNQGLIHSTLQLPVQIRLAHLAYRERLDTMYQSSQTIYLDPDIRSLDEVVITGQYLPQSAQKSLYKVKTIDRERLAQQGANTLQDVLANQLNINFSRDNAMGASGMNLMGIAGQHIKILIDGIPVAGRGGINNEIDINQLNINSIEQVEIVEGPMAVNFGADALAGVINIITKKDDDQQLNLDLTLQEETVESNYSFFREGIHSPSLRIGYKPAERWYLQAEGRINHFGGWVGNGSERNRQWYPKTQYFGSNLIRYEAQHFNIYYRLDYLDESIENLGEVNDSNPLRDPFATDESFQSQRWMHQLQAEVHLNNRWHLNPVFSFTDYQRTTRQFNTNLVTGQTRTTIQSEQDSIYFRNYFFRNVLSQTDGEWGSLQLGMEATHEQAAGTTISQGEKWLTDLALFASAEIHLNPKLQIRPGIRFSRHSLFKTQPTPSINLKYDLHTQVEVRIGYGRGFRAPSLREMYHEFIDANHNIQGNQDLEPEYSHSFNADITYRLPKLNISTSLTGFYNHIDNMITFFTPTISNQSTTYVNLLKFKTAGLRLTGQWRKSWINLSSGVAYTGRYQRLRQENRDVPGFVFGWEANLNNTFIWSQTGISASLFYKFNGPFKDYRLVDQEGESRPQLQQINGFHLMDFTLSKDLGSNLKLTAGIRNLMNVNTVNNNLTGGGAHSGETGKTSVAYGRSYFLRINLNLKSMKINEN